jgi:hypothetical protein
MHRLDLLTLKGQDTTQMVPKSQQMTSNEVDQRINAQVELLVRQKVEELMRAHNARPVTLPKGLQERPKRLSAKKYAEINAAQRALWTERAKLMDYREPVYTSTGQFNKNWLKSAGYRWEEYCKTHTAPESLTEAPAEGAPV